MSWGLNQVAVKVAVAEVPPLTSGLVRSFGAASIVFAWATVRGIPLFRRDGTLRPGLFSGLMFGLQFACMFIGMQFTTASRGVVFIYTAPIFIALGACVVLPGERLRGIQWLGPALAFLGVAVALGAPAPSAEPRFLLGDGLMILAGASWAAYTLTTRATCLLRAPYEKVLLYQLVGSIPVFVLGALGAGESWPAAASTTALGAVVYQTLWVAGPSYLIWVNLLQRYDASRLAVFTYLTPVLGVLFSWSLLGERLTLQFAIGAVLVLLGLVLVNARR